MTRVCVCGFATNDVEWFADHTAGRPEHREQNFSLYLWVITAERNRYRRRRQAMR
jgi:hypothetical protein